MTKVLVPADSLRALYNPYQSILTLFAIGQVPQYIYDIQFERLPWVGGLKFELFGWSDVGIPEHRKYEREQEFFIPNLAKVCPSGYILIETANYPQGQKVPVRWVGLNREPIEQPLSHVTGGENSNTLDRETTTINVLFGLPFDIKESVDCSAGSRLRAQFNDKALVMQNAGYEDGNLIWAMNSLETGETDFIVFKTHGLTDLIIRKVYRIRVFVLGFGAAPDKPLCAYTFKDRLTRAEQIVQAKDPNAKLIRVKATRGGISTGQPVYDPHALEHLECEFATDNGKWITESECGLDWSPPRFDPDGVAGKVPFSVSDLVYGIEDAARKLREAGYRKPFWWVELYALFTDAPSDPKYRFVMSDDTTIAVNAKTGEVTPEHVVILLSRVDSGRGIDGTGAVDGAKAANNIPLKQIEAASTPGS